MKTNPFAMEQFQENPFLVLDRDWMLVTAGIPDDFNTLTVSWGGFGVLWNLPVFYAFVRHSRYTFAFMEKYAYFTCAAFDEAYRDALTLCGTKSGRELDKVAAAGLTPSGIHGLDAVSFNEARLTLVCRKLFSQDMLEQNFVDHKVFTKNYDDPSDIHRLYVGVIEQMG